MFSPFVPTMTVITNGSSLIAINEQIQYRAITRLLPSFDRIQIDEMDFTALDSHYEMSNPFASAKANSSPISRNSR